MGYQKLAANPLCRESVNRYVYGWSYIYDYYCRIIFHWRYFRRVSFRQMDTTKFERTRIYGAIGLGLIIPSLLLIGFGHSLIMVIAGGVFFLELDSVCLMPTICLSCVSSYHRGTEVRLMG